MKKIIDGIEETRKKINSIDFDAHWYRRVFHTFGASFVVYYIVPDVEWINIGKFWIPICIVLIALLLELLRIKGKINSNHFFGLRRYEQKRASSYLFFGMGILILLLFFPQQIALPCILCACIADPIIGEVRNRFDKNTAVFVGFLVCFLIFILTWYKTEDIMILLGISIIGSSAAVIGEVKKIWWLDDDFMIQILPAVILFLLWFALTNLYGLDILPEKIIFPIDYPW